MRLLILALITASFANAQNVNIPDANFKAYLVGNTAINTNGDTEIQVTEATAFNGDIIIPSLSISDLTGIEAFTGLTGLACSNNQLTSLDVSSNTALGFLYCFNNQLTSLDVSNNNALTGLNCSNNNLTSLDVTQNTALDFFYCKSNSLTCLNVKNGNNLNLSWFEVEANPNLTCIEVDDATWSTANWTVAGGNIDAQMSFSTNCNNACSNVAVGISELNSNQPKDLIKIVNLLGQETAYRPNTPLIYIYSDGSTERVMKMEE